MCVTIYRIFFYDWNNLSNSRAYVKTPHYKVTAWAFLSTNSEFTLQAQKVSVSNEITMA